MSGHNKWSKIKRQKEATDAQKSKIFGKLLRAISTEVKIGGSNSPTVKTAVEKARAANVPNENIERAIKKASDIKENLETVIYETYGPGGCAIIVEALTSNRNKASQEIKHILGEHGLSLAGMCSATWAFEKSGSSWTAKNSIALSEEDGNKLSQLLDDLEDNDEVQEVYTNAE